MKKMILVNLIVVFAIQSSALSATLLVPDDYPGIQMAIGGSMDGDTIIVAPGTYYETINFMGKNIVLTSTDPNDPEVVAGTIIDADGDGSTVTFENGETAAAVLRGFTITGGYGTRNDAAGSGILWGGGIYCFLASPTITCNVIADNHAPFDEGTNPDNARYGYGSAIGGLETAVIITRNIIKDNTTYAGAGIFIIGDPTISDNLIYDNSGVIGGGIILAGGSLINNTFVGNDASFQGGSQIGGNILVLYDPGYPSMRIINNVICNARSGGGLLFFGGDLSADSVAFNNVWNNNPGDYGFFSNQTGQLIWGGQYERTGNYGNISEDPLFVDAEEHDYHLQTGSPCINAGDPASIVMRDREDFDGESRVYGGAVDIGAYEYRGYVPPVADAGPDQHVDMPRQATLVVTLDGSGSFFYELCSVMEYSWEQVGGEAVVMNDVASANPTFIPGSEGEYRFELVVSDGLNMSEPDEVIIIASNLPPIADAGPDQSHSSIPQLIRLKGRDSYDRSGDPVTFRWSQTDGPAVDLIDASSDAPTFVPSELGVYVFELIVSDGELDSEPDEVGIVIGNHAPVADVGLPRYAGVDPVVLDGSGSFDPDAFGEIRYQWQQISGPSVSITDENTVMPTVSGFTQTNEIQRCEFELTVSDGDMDSEPDTVEVIIVPDFGNASFLMANPPFDPDKPTMVAFGGGNCEVGGGMVFSEPDEWYAKVNFLTISSYEPPYDRYADPLIVFLSSVAPNYVQPIQTIGFDTGSMPAIDIANRINETYADARFAVNRISLLDATCRDYSDDIARFLASRVDGEPCWIENYYATEGRYYPGTLNIRFPAPNANHSTPLNWYQQSFNPGGGARRRPLYNGGLTAGFYISVAGPAKNLQLSADVDNYHFEWDPQTNVLRFYDASLHPGRLPEEVKLVGPEDGALMGADGAVLSCQTNDTAVSYRLLFGAAPDRLDYLVSDTPEPPDEVITEFPFETTYWTVMVSDEFGTTIYADPLSIRVENVTDSPDN